MECIYSFNDDDNNYDKYDVINAVTFLLLSDWLRGARWAWLEQRGDGKSDKSPLCRVASQTTEQTCCQLQQVRNKLVASW